MYGHIWCSVTILLLMVGIWREFWVFEDFTGRRNGGYFLVTVGREMWSCGAWHKED